MTTVFRTALLVVLVMLSATFVGAHDFWLVPDAFRIAANGEVVVRGQTSSAFPTTLSAVTPDRVTEARIVGAADDERITALSTRDNSLVLRHRPKTAGQKVVAVAVGWRHANETAASFREYLVGEGAEDALKHYDRTGQLPTADIDRRAPRASGTCARSTSCLRRLAPTRTGMSIGRRWSIRSSSAVEMTINLADSRGRESASDSGATEFR